MSYYQPRQIDFNDLDFCFQQRAFHEFQRLDPSLQDENFGELMESNDPMPEGPDYIPWANIHPY